MFIRGLILLIIVGGALVHLLVEFLNLSRLTNQIPDEFKEIYDPKKYKTSQEYLKTNTFLDLIQTAITTPLLTAFIVFGGFQIIDSFARSFELQEMVTAVIFVATLSLLSTLLSLPFSIYHTFVIEERFGFNKMTWKTFVLDRIKGLLLMAIIGIPVFLVVLWFFQQEQMWIWAWLFTVSVEIFMLFVAPVVIFPLFNKFEPLEEGELKSEIEKFAKSQNFKLQGIFKMDGSKRSTKANAYFTGFGRFRRIVLFDTLIQKHSVNELVAILAHEIGHYKRGHIFKQLTLSISTSLLLFFFLSKVIYNEEVFEAFHVEQMSVYAGLVFAGLLYSPVSSILGLFSLYLSRLYEFEADAYASATTHKPEDLVSGLKRLSVDSLSNLSPHPVKVFLEYTHPPVLDRVAALRKN
ncbi:MAG: M48 family metallopeptidase [Bacteriovoracia bacterium]